MPNNSTSDVLERLRGLLSQATARPWTAFDRANIRAIMKGKEPPLKANGYHSRRWPEIVAWSGFDGSHVPERYRSPNLHLIVEAVNALPELLAIIERLSAELERVKGAAAAVDAMWSENLEPGQGPDDARSEQVRIVWKRLRAALNNTEENR